MSNPFFFENTPARRILLANIQKNVSHKEVISSRHQPCNFRSSVLSMLELFKKLLNAHCEQVIVAVDDSQKCEFVAWKIICGLNS
jgi:hypothetical protein